jgi:hypothetical protein
MHILSNFKKIGRPRAWIVKENIRQHLKRKEFNIIDRILKKDYEFARDTDWKRLPRMPYFIEFVNNFNHLLTHEKPELDDKAGKEESKCKTYSHKFFLEWSQNEHNCIAYREFVETMFMGDDDEINVFHLIKILKIYCCEDCKAKWDHWKATKTSLKLSFRLSKDCYDKWIALKFYMIEIAVNPTNMREMPPLLIQEGSPQSPCNIQQPIHQSESQEPESSVEYSGDMEEVITPSMHY